MDERGVDVHVVSAIPAVTPAGGADAQTALDLNRRYNDRIAVAVRDHPGRLVGSFTLPLRTWTSRWPRWSACTVSWD